jgi:hypothetical protein
LPFVFFSCKKNTNNNIVEEPNNPQLIHYLDSMLASIGINSYNDVLIGKLEGNFGFYSYYYPFNANCATSSIPFILNTKLSGGVSLDTPTKDTI